MSIALGFTILFAVVGLHLQLLSHMDKKFDRLEDLIIKHITDMNIHGGSK